MGVFSEIPGHQKTSVRNYAQRKSDDGEDDGDDDGGDRDGEGPMTPTGAKTTTAAASCQEKSQWV